MVKGEESGELGRGHAVRGLECQSKEGKPQSTGKGHPGIGGYMPTCSA